MDSPTPCVVALIPAHNEGAQIAATVESLRLQSLPLQKIVVVADNCTDDTVAVARAAGALVVETVGNRAKKAGAMNQGMDAVGDCDYLLQMDADTILDPDFVQKTVAELKDDERLAGVCARFLGKDEPGFLTTLQRMEYQRHDLNTRHKPYGIHCLSGTATLFRFSVLPSQPWDERNLVEDYALSLDLLERGFKIKRAADSYAWTETKPTLKEFWTQRLRWSRGTLDELVKRGLSRHTRKTTLSQVVGYSVITLRWLWLSAMLSTFMMSGPTFSLLWMIPLPLMLAERVKSVWSLGWPARLLAATLLPDEFYQLVREGYMLHALWSAFRKREVAW